MRFLARFRSVIATLRHTNFHSSAGGIYKRFLSPRDAIAESSRPTLGSQKVLLPLISLRKKKFVSAGFFTSHAANEGSRNRPFSPDEWKTLYRAFLLHVHPDFFCGYPRERAVNDANLKILSLHLDRDGTRNVQVSGNDTVRLAFFFKPVCTLVGELGASADSGNGTGDRTRPLKTMLHLHARPDDTRSELQRLLRAAGVDPVDVSSRPRTTSDKDGKGRAPDHFSNVSQWTDNLFESTIWHRAGMPRHAPHSSWQADSSHGGVDDDRQFQQRRQARRSDGKSEFISDRQGPGHVLATESGKALVRERRSSARRVRMLVEALKAQHGFGSFSFRCGWSQSNLCIALASLLETCAAHQEELKVTNFGGLPVVFRNDPSVLHDGEIRLSPADVPLAWVSTLQSVTPAVLTETRGQQADIGRLEKRVSTILGGIAVSRGLSCSTSRYYEFLRQASSEGDKNPRRTDITFGQAKLDRSNLQCKVEEGFGRSSQILADGTIQIGSDMSLGILRECLSRDVHRAAAIAIQSAHLAHAAAAARTRCRQALGLDGIDRARGVEFQQMIIACETLAKPESKESAMGDNLQRLRGHCVRIVQSRFNAEDGVTEDGEIAVPWNWMGVDVDEQQKREHPSSFSFQ